MTEESKLSVPYGTVGTVVGFDRYVHYQSRIGVYSDPPGKYCSNGSVIVRWDNGVFDRPSMHDVMFVDKDLKDSRTKDDAYNAAFTVAERVSDLPDLPLWELDSVRLKPNYRSPWEDCDALVVSHIAYDYMGDVCSDGVTPMPIYRVEPPSMNRGCITVHPDNLELIERGNVWWWTHDRSKVAFADLDNEVRFHKMIGLCTEVQCPQTGHYGWPKEHLHSGATSGLIDVVFQRIGSSFSFCGKMHDPDLSARCNARLIKSSQ